MFLLRTISISGETDKRIIERYMDSIEEIINIPVLPERLNTVVEQGKLNNVMAEIIIHSKVEFNFQDDLQGAAKQATRGWAVNRCSKSRVRPALLAEPCLQGKAADAR